MLFSSKTRRIGGNSETWVANGFEVCAITGALATLGGGASVRPASGSAGVLDAGATGVAGVAGVTTGAAGATAPEEIMAGRGVGGVSPDGNDDGAPGCSNEAG